jgi:UDP-N-acetylglucosamine 4,6-dehydratase/5-epimerase
MESLQGNILITGGTGTLGRAIVARAMTEAWSSTLTIYSRDELKQYEMRRQYPECRYVLGDVQDADTLRRVLVGHDLVIHAAAQKHIPEGEANPWQTMQTNVLGSAGVLWAAAEAGVKEVILISTDKVCHPVNVYGATKLLMERHAQTFALSNYGRHVKVKMLRYGNVLGSNGSVLQVWEKQVRTGQAIQITDPDMTRFWITESMAVDLILETHLIWQGRIYIPKIKSLSMRALKDALYPDHPHTITGLRPGEKMHEELITEEERPYAHEFETHFELNPVSGHPVTGPGPAYTSANCARYTADEIRAMAAA